MLTIAQRDHLEIVLVSPRNPLNIGAAARAMANFGFSNLTVVAPWEPHWREAQSAIGAESLLQSAKSAERLEEAVAGCTLVIGTGTLSRRKPEQAVIPLPELFPLVRESLAGGGRVALVFGPEKRGLTRDDLSYCHRLAVIPTSAAQPSMNLGQAVAVCLYEFARHAQPTPGSPEPPAAAGPASSAELDRLASAVEEAMLASDYSPAEMRAANRHDLRLLLRRLAFNNADARRALGFFRRVIHKLNQ